MISPTASFRGEEGTATTVAMPPIDFLWSIFCLLSLLFPKAGAGANHMTGLAHPQIREVYTSFLYRVVHIGLRMRVGVGKVSLT